MHLKDFSKGVLASVFSLGWLLFSSTTFGTPQQTRGRDPVIPEAIPIVVSPDGFLQGTLSIPNGSYVFVIVNRTGPWDITVSLERMPGNALSGAASHQEFREQVGRTRKRLIKSAQLARGTYRLSVENRPSWVSAIQVK